MNRPADSSSVQRLLLGLIMLAVFVWGAIHAIGALLFNMGFWDLWKAVIVFAFVMAFLGFWMLMLFQRRRREK